MYVNAFGYHNCFCPQITAIVCKGLQIILPGKLLANLLQYTFRCYLQTSLCNNMHECIPCEENPVYDIVPWFQGWSNPGMNASQAIVIYDVRRWLIAFLFPCYWICLSEHVNFTSSQSRVLLPALCQVLTHYFCGCEQLFSCIILHVYLMISVYLRCTYMHFDYAGSINCMM